LTQNDNKSAIGSSHDSGNLRLDFYESGDGDTIIITFPGGGLGVVDAHPSPTSSRQDILDLIAGRKLHFVCLTHPHSDHGLDLVPVLQKHPEVDEFWHTTPDVGAFIYRLQEIQTWPSEVREFAVRMAKGWASFLIDLWAEVDRRDMPMHQVRAGDEAREFDGVLVHALAPEEAVQQRFFQFWCHKAEDPTLEKPDPNLLSAVFALRWGESVVLLGADALKANWIQAVKRYRKLNLPKAVVLKVPHHGALNSLQLETHSKYPSYLDICSHKDQKCKAVLFAGDSKHPNSKVYDRLLARTDVHCLVNGLRSATPGRDLGIELEGARPVSTGRPCQPVVSFELAREGSVQVLAGVTCSHCPFAP